MYVKYVCQSHQTIYNKGDADRNLLCINDRKNCELAKNMQLILLEKLK